MYIPFPRLLALFLLEPSAPRYCMRCTNHSVACRLGGDVGTWGRGAFRELRPERWLRITHSGPLHCSRLTHPSSKPCTASYLFLCPNNMTRQVTAICKIVRLAAKRKAIVRRTRPNMYTDTVWASSWALLASLNAWICGGGSRIHLK